MRTLLALVFILLPSVLKAAETSNPGGELEKWTMGKVDTIPVKPAPELGKSPPPAAHYSPVFNINGDWGPSNETLAQHLSSTHHINPEGMTRDQMFAAHDRAHGVGRAVQSYSNNSSCPGGVCPATPMTKREARQQFRAGWKMQF